MLPDPQSWTITVPKGRWLRRKDTREDLPRYTVLLYGLDDGVLVIWSDGTHSIEPEGKKFPSSNWEVWSEIESV